MERIKLFKLGICSALVLSAQVFAAPPKTWDAIFNAEGQGDYTAAKIDGNIRFGEYTHYKNIQPVSFRILDDKFDFSVAGNMTVPAKMVEDPNFYESCRNTMEAWVSYFDKPRRFGNEDLIINIAGVDFACGNDLFNVHDLRIKFTNPQAQKAWVAELEGRQKYKREQLSAFRVAEQEHRAEIRDKSTSFTDPRDGQVYRIIKVEGREWFAQNVNYNVEGHSWCYEDKDSYCARSGRLYDLEGARKACPEGWHLPGLLEWIDLINYVGGQEMAGVKLKSKAYWYIQEEFAQYAGTDDYGFSILPGSFMSEQGSFGSTARLAAHLWTSTEETDTRSNDVFLMHSMGKVVLEGSPRDVGMSVRCLKDSD